MWQRVRPLATMTFFAFGTLVASLTVLWPRTTHADLTEIPDSERQGDYDEDGMMFGNIVVKGQLVADAKAPGGWALVRTYENKGDTAETCTLEERVLRTETMPDARVNPRSIAVIVRTQKIALGPHEKRSVGVYLPPAIGAQMTQGHKTKANIEQQRDALIAAEKYDLIQYGRTYTSFDVEYLKPLLPGTKAEVPVDNGVFPPAAMPVPMPPPPPASPELARFDSL